MGQVTAAAEERGLELRVTVGDDIGTIRTDPDRLTQILLNLLSNSVKFTDEGFVSLEVEREPGYVKFTVTDSGPGISESERERVFEAFHQVRTRSDAKPTGTGLGLTISREMAQMLDGSLTLDGPAAGGASFALRLPSLDETRDTEESR